MPEPVLRGGVDPVDSGLYCVADGGDGLCVVLRSPPIGPVTTAERPRAQSHRGELPTGGTDSRVGIVMTAPRRRASGAGHLGECRRVGRCHGSVSAMWSVWSRVGGAPARADAA